MCGDAKTRLEAQREPLLGSASTQSTTPHIKRDNGEKNIQTLMTPSSGPVAKELPSQAQARGRAVASSFQWGGRRSPSLLSKCCKLVPWRLKGLVCHFCFWWQCAQDSTGLSFRWHVSLVQWLIWVKPPRVHRCQLSMSPIHGGSSYGLTASANMWHGIELADIRANKCGGAVVTADVSALRA